MLHVGGIYYIIGRQVSGAVLVRTIASGHQHGPFTQLAMPAEPCHEHGSWPPFSQWPWSL